MPPSLFVSPMTPQCPCGSSFWILKEICKIVSTSAESHLVENFIIIFCKELQQGKIRISLLNIY